jgi:hypothetical protein
LYDHQLIIMDERSLLATHLQRKPPTRAQLVREHLIEEIRPIRLLLSALVVLPWQAVSDHPVLEALIFFGS